MKSPLSFIVKIALSSLFVFLLCLSVSAQNQNDPPAFKPGLEINRDELISKIIEFDPTLVFKQKKDSIGLPNFVAVNSRGSNIQLIGKTDELVLAKWIFIPSGDNATNDAELQRIQWFCSTLGGPNGWEWYSGAIAEINKASDKPYSNEKAFNYNRKGEFKYSPKEKNYTLTFVPW
jgi:hypothetical protein